MNKKFSISYESIILMGLYNSNKINEYNMDSLDVQSKIKLLNYITNNTKRSSDDFKNNKDYKMKDEYELFNYIVENYIKIYSENPSINDNITSLIIKLNKLSKGQYLLVKLNRIINKMVFCDNYITGNILDTAEKGTMGSFLYWLNKYSKSLETINFKILDEIFIKSISNSDDRIYKYFLTTIVTNKTSYYKENKNIILHVLSSLFNAEIPTKYILRRLKLLSQYIELNCLYYLEYMIECTYDFKILVEINKYYYSSPHTFTSLLKLACRLCYTDQNNMIVLQKKIDILNNILKTDNEKTMLEFIFSLKFNTPIKINENNIKSIVTNNLNQIFMHIDWFDISYMITSNMLIKYVLEHLTSNKLVNRYIEMNQGNITNIIVLLYSRFLNVDTINDKNVCKKAISINYVLHRLRLLAKKKYKTNVINRNVKMFNILNEIKTYQPNHIVKVLNTGSYNYQMNRMKFTNLPPRHLYPGEIGIYNNFLLRDKADGILINNMPTNIFPSNYKINNNMVKAEYIEELDLYLVFDIDIMNTTIMERYNILRNMHPYTIHTKLQHINSIEEFYSIQKEEGVNLKRFLNDNIEHTIKWYPKFACNFNNNNNNKELIENIIYDTVKEYDLYKCDGLILTPINGDREIKIKPLHQMSIDLYYNGDDFVDRSNVIWTKYISLESVSKRIKLGIYRLYPKFIDNILYFTVGEKRFEKKKANTTEVVDNIIHIIKYNWRDTVKDTMIYYDMPKKITNNIINDIKMQRSLLETNINLLQPNNNAKWLDLGCGNGKLVNIIKKFNPRYYMGLDSDIKQLVRALRIQDENTDCYFNPCNLKTWDATNSWFSIPDYKFDYIVANFSLMHFNTDEFWAKLNTLVHNDTKFIFNLVNTTSIVSWEKHNSYLKVDNDITKYYFEWVHSMEKTEPYISIEILQAYLNKYNWKIIKKFENTNNNSLGDIYDWFIATKM